MRTFRYPWEPNVSLHYTPYASLSLASAAALAVLAALAWGRRDAPGAKAFAALMLAGCWWKLVYALVLASGGLDAKLFWVKVEYLGVVTMPLAWLALALGYAGVWGRRTRRRVLALLAVVPLATLALVWTNGARGEPHGLVWASAALDRSGPFAALELAGGLWYPVHVAYSYALVLAGTVALVAGVARAARPYRPQGLALLAGVLVSWGANALYLAGFSPVVNLNPSVLVFPVTGALFALGLLRWRLLDLSPVARDAAFGASGDGLVVVDPGGRVVDANPAAERIFGRPARRLLGTGVFALIPARFPPLDAARPAGEADRREVSLADQRGSPRRYELTQAPLEDRGGPGVGRLITLRDVTERELAAETLREANRRLEELASLRADVTAMVAHEIGTPLAAIRAYSDILGLADVPPGVRADALARVRAEAEGIATLVADVRSAAAVERGAFDLRPRPVRAGELLDDAARFAGTLTGDHPIVVEADAAEETVRADPYRAGQVLRNLLTNVAKYSPDGSPITLRAVRGDAPGRVRIEVADRGAGVRPEDAGRIFEKFGRGGDPGGRGAYGVGLGLYLSRRIAQAHGGELAHRPNPGGGSVFYFELPTEVPPDPER